MKIEREEVILFSTWVRNWEILKVW